MAFDVNNQFTGKFYGPTQTMGHTTPDLEVSDVLRPWLPVAYPAPYLPSLRPDFGHPVRAGIVLSSQHLVGLDSSGSLVPSGLFCGSQPTVANGGQYCILVYGTNDIGFCYNASTGTNVQQAGEHAVLAAPSDAVAGNVTMPDGTIVVVSAADITFAKACTLFDTGVSRPIGVATRNVYQYIGGVKVYSTTGGMNYRLDGVVPTGFIINNYMHEMGTAIQTQYVIRVPWVGPTRYALTADAAADGITGYAQGYGLTFAHFTGVPLKGQGVVASAGLQDYGNYSCYTAANSPTDVIGRVLGVMNMINKIGYMNRVRTLWDSSKIINVPGVQQGSNASNAMGGSATGGIDYPLNLTTDGIYKLSLNQGKQARPEYGTYVILRINL